MSKCTDIRDICGDYAFDVEYSENNKFTMFFNSRRNAETVKRCIEVDDSVPNAATAVDFVEVVRCKDCKHLTVVNNESVYARCEKTGYIFWSFKTDTREHFCAYGERREKNEG